MKNYFDESVVFEKNGEKFALLPLCIFHDIPSEERGSVIKNQFGVADIYKTKSLYRIVDEKKFMLLKIKYNV